jgi:hypothetical protein
LLEKREERIGNPSIDASAVAQKIHENLPAENIPIFFPTINRSIDVFPKHNRGKSIQDKPEWRKVCDFQFFHVVCLIVSSVYILAII